MGHKYYIVHLKNTCSNVVQWIGLRDNLQDNPIFNIKNHGFRFRFSLNPMIPMWLHFWTWKITESLSLRLRLAKNQARPGEPSGNPT